MNKTQNDIFDWMGYLPDRWETVKLKYLGSYRNGLTYSPDDIVDNEKGTLVLRSSNIKDGKLCFDDTVFVDIDDNSFLVQEGDILICSRNGSKDLIGKNALIPANTYAYFGAFMMIYRCSCPNYMFYILNSDIFSCYLGSFFTSTINQLTGSNFGNILIPFCKDKNVQQRIVDYLESKCSQIDSIIARQENIIAKLKEYEQSIISEAVTKGLNSNVKMINSEIEWIGNYPAHWDISSLKNVLFERNEKNDPVLSRERLSLSIDKGVTLYSDKTTNLDRFKDDVSQYKLAHEGDLVLNSMNMIVGAIGISKWFGCVSPAYYTFYDNVADHITARYCDYLLRCKTMRKVLFALGKGIMSIERGDDRINTCRLKVSRTDLRALKIPVPPEEEQRSIVEYLDTIGKRIDCTISNREKIIEKLKNYKKSLIFEIVTGKKEV